MPQPLPCNINLRAPEAPRAFPLPHPGAAAAAPTRVAEGEQEAQVLQPAALLHHDQVDEAVAAVAVPAGIGVGGRQGRVRRLLQQGLHALARAGIAASKYC